MDMPKRNESLLNRLSKEEKDELRETNKCFLCKSEGHFARNCPSKSRAKSSNGKPLDLSAYGIRVNLDQVEQQHVASLNEITKMSIGMIWGDTHSPEFPYQSPWAKELDSDGDTIPDLQSVSDSEEEEGNELDSLNSVSGDSDASIAQPLLGEEEVTVLPPMTFPSMYSLPMECAEDKLRLLDMDSLWERLGDAVCNKVEEMLESMQPYPGDPANVLQFRGHQFLAAATTFQEILVYNKVFDAFNILPRSAAE
ncbi:hypothetical protein C0993_009943 [Termitomyces sp. T159_Od127]|nr:hypothetical protein C0993_009943 [Termitomyces sp. T159_Od127]